MGISSGSQSGSSQGSSQFTSNPVNLQYPSYQNLAPGVAGGLTGQFGQLGNTQGNPYQVFNPSTGNFVNSNDTAQNPLVGGLTSSELQGLTQAEQFATGAYPGGNGMVGQGFGLATTGASTAGSAPGIVGNGFNLTNAGAATASAAPGIVGNGFNEQRVGADIANAAPGFIGSGFNQQLAGAQQFPGAQTAAHGADSTLANFLSPGYAASLATSPQTQAAIQSAINPLLTSFQQSTVPALQGQFTAGGQRVTAGGSSAFDRAANEAQNNLLSQIGSVAGGITNNAYLTGLGQQANAVSQTQGLANTIGNLASQQIAGGSAQAQTGATMAGVGATQAGIGSAEGQLGSAMAGVGATQAGIGQAQGQLGATMAGIGGTQAGIGQTQAGIGTQELNNVLSNLQAQALPRLIQQYGINQGLSLYQQQTGSLLQALGLGGQISQPAIAYNSQGTSQQSGSSSGKSGGFNLG